MPEDQHSTHDGLAEHRVPRDGGSLYVRDYAGAGPAFVMMHGFPDNLHIYDDLVPHLVAGGRRVVTFDFLGFGQSDKPGQGYSFEQQVQDLVAVVSHLGLGPIVPVAHDSSGPAAINFALDYRSQTSAVVVLNAFYGGASTMKFPELIAFFASRELKALTSATLKAPDQFAWVLNFQRDQFRKELSPEHAEHYASFLGPLIDENFRQQPSSAPAFAAMTGVLFEEVDRNSERIAELKGSDVPFMLIWGERDPYLNVGVARELCETLGNGSLTLLNAGHWVQIDEPRRVAELMLQT